MSLALQRISIGSEITENFDGPDPVTTVAPTPGLRVLQQRIEDVDTAGRRCETIVLETDRTTLGRILFSIPESAIIDEFLAHVRLRCDHPSARLACQIVLPQLILKTGNPSVFLFLDHPRQPHHAGNLLLSEIFLLFFARNYLHYEHSTGLKLASMAQRFLDWLWKYLLE